MGSIEHVSYSFTMRITNCITWHLFAVTIEDDDLCSEVQVRKVKLGKGPNSGLIVRQSRLNDHSLQWPLNKLCSFKVEAYSAKNNFHIPFLSPRHGESGVFAVIQYIVFRKNETTGECIDYVQFTSHDDVVSKKYCGVLSTALLMDAQFAAFDPSEEYGGISSKSFVKVDIFISKMPLREGEEMDLNIVFTSYKGKPLIFQDLNLCTYLLCEQCIFFIEPPFFKIVYIVLKLKYSKFQNIYYWIYVSATFSFVLVIDKPF